MRAPKKRELSKAQKEVLGLLRVKERPTSKTTAHGYISGICADTLIRNGLAKRRWDEKEHQWFCGITPEGSKAYKRGWYIKKPREPLAPAPTAEAPTEPKNVGLQPYRFADNPDEKRFAEAWEAQNIASQTLGHLLRAPDVRFPTEMPSARDRSVAATVIQWLGSPVGQCFLRDLGFVKKDETPPAWEEIKAALGWKGDKLTFETVFGPIKNFDHHRLTVAMIGLRGEKVARRKG